MDRRVIRGDIWLAEVGSKIRPVVILTRTEVIDVRHSVTVAEVTTSIRGIAAEVALDHIETGLDQASVINCDGLQTIRRSSLTRRVGSVGDATMGSGCRALNYALDC